MGATPAFAQGCGLCRDPQSKEGLNVYCEDNMAWISAPAPSSVQLLLFSQGSVAHLAHASPWARVNAPLLQLPAPSPTRHAPHHDRLCFGVVQEQGRAGRPNNAFKEASRLTAAHLLLKQHVTCPLQNGSTVPAEVTFSPQNTASRKEYPALKLLVRRNL